MADLLRIPPIAPTDFAEVVSVLTPMNAIYAVPEDIHKHTAYLGAQCKRIFLRLDDKYHLAPAGDFETIAREITALSGNDASVITVLGSIRAAGSTVDSETGLNIRDLLVRTWGLACHPLAPQKITTYEHPGIQINARQVVVENLQHNKKTGGGCLPGISARLTQPYCTFTAFILEQAMLRQKESHDSAASQLPGVHTITTMTVVPHVAAAAAAAVSRKPTREEIDAEQADTQAAIIASLPPANAAPSEAEQADIQAAIIASLPPAHAAPRSPVLVSGELGIELTAEEISEQAVIMESMVRGSQQLAPAPRYMPTYERERAARTSSVPHSDDSGLDEDTKAQFQAAYGSKWREYI